MGFASGEGFRWCSIALHRAAISPNRVSYAQIGRARCEVFRVQRSWGMHTSGLLPTLARVRRAAREWWADLMALVWPTSCVGCGAADRDCCADCRAQVRGAQVPAIWVHAPAGVTVCAASWYSGALREMLVACKHQGRTGFARELGVRLRTSLRAVLSGRMGTVYVVTAPSRAARVRERGYRHVDMIVRRAIRRWVIDGEGLSDALSPRPSPSLPPSPHVRLLPRALKALPGRSGQVGLDAHARAANAALITIGTAARYRLRGAQVVLVDDIVTTGATVAAAKHELEAAGAEVLGIVALCAVERRSEVRHARSKTQVDEGGGNAIGFVKGVMVRPALWPPA